MQMAFLSGCTNLVEYGSGAGLLSHLISSKRGVRKVVLMEIDPTSASYMEKKVAPSFDPGV